MNMESVLTLYEERLERVAKAIWEAQHEKVKGTITKSRVWRDKSVPDIFWQGYRNDAKAALAALGLDPR